MTDVAEIARSLTKAQREMILACRHKATGASGERWDFFLLGTRSRTVLINRGIAQGWGVVSASLTPLGLAVRDYLKEQG